MRRILVTAVVVVIAVILAPAAVAATARTVASVPPAAARIGTACMAYLSDVVHVKEDETPAPPGCVVPTPYTLVIASRDHLLVCEPPGVGATVDRATTTARTMSPAALVVVTDAMSPPVARLDGVPTGVVV